DRTEIGLGLEADQPRARGIAKRRGERRLAVDRHEVDDAVVFAEAAEDAEERALAVCEARRRPALGISREEHVGALERGHHAASAVVVGAFGERRLRRLAVIAEQEERDALRIAAAAVVLF